MLGETGRWVMGPIHGSGDFLAYGSPSISAAKMTGTQKKKEVEQRNLDKKKVTWKRVVATPFSTPQECVGRNRSNQATTDKQLGVSSIQRRMNFPLQQQRTNNQ